MRRPELSFGGLLVAVAVLVAGFAGSDASARPRPDRGSRFAAERRTSHHGMTLAKAKKKRPPGPRARPSKAAPERRPTTRRATTTQARAQPRAAPRATTPRRRSRPRSRAEEEEGARRRRMTGHRAGAAAATRQTAKAELQGRSRRVSSKASEECRPTRRRSALEFGIGGKALFRQPRLDVRRARRGPRAVLADARPGDGPLVRVLPGRVRDLGFRRERRPVRPLRLRVRRGDDARERHERRDQVPRLSWPV